MRYARLRFVVAFGVAAIATGVASAAGSEIGVALAVCVGGLAWACMLLDEVHGARAASAAFGVTAHGFTRGQVARGIVLSWLIPGLGQIHAGERIAGMLTSTVFLCVWVVANLELVPTLVGLSVGLALWVAGQVRVRRLLGVTWDPLIPSLGEIFRSPLTGPYGSGNRARHNPGVTESSGRRKPRRWKDMSRVEKYAFVQHQVLFLALYLVAVSLVATNVGVGTAIFVFGGGILLTAVATFIGIRRERHRSR